ncbi:hypothetical protein ROZALSC1DRAFT_22067 [Rozella allomycis CSF55]|uniref:Uncharacterized protein n=1 Tax=Rozella allomycis (strain CSF55) TaxID=988480 RepID=A0A4P9YJU8_ROZAC|nr:hypothetical protein ROZALSC1DRAFT_22067 [Rozella allomycis CSF55]
MKIIILAIVFLNVAFSLETCSLKKSEPRMGKITLANNNELQVSVVVGENRSRFNLTLGLHTLKLINSHIATFIGLKSHPKLIVVSRMGDGSAKYDFLAVVHVEVNGIGSSLVMKVAPNQPNLLGLDAIFRFGMVIDPVQRVFSQSTAPLKDNEHLFDFFDLKRYMSKLGITQEDLIPVEDLPDPNVAYIDLLKAGSAHAVINLGPSFTIGLGIRSPVLNLGVGN